MQTLRGTGAEVIICEEAAYMDPDVFYKVVVPLLEVRNTALLCISTPVSEFNYYDDLCTKKDERGDFLFNVVAVRMICDYCLAHNAEPETCTHCETERPEWKSFEASVVARKMCPFFLNPGFLNPGP